MRAAMLCLVVACGSVRAADLPELAKQVKDQDPRVRLKAVQELKAMGRLAEDSPAAVRGICDAIADPSPAVSTAALSALEAVSPELYKPVSSMFVNRELSRRKVALQEIGRLKSRGKPAAGLVGAVVTQAAAGAAEVKSSKGGSVHAEVIVVGIATFAAVEANEPDVWLLLLKLAQPPMKHYVRAEAVSLLGSWAGDDTIRHRNLLPLLNAGFGDEPTIQIASLKAAAKLGRYADSLSPAVERLKLSKSSAVRTAASDAAKVIAGQ